MRALKTQHMTNRFSFSRYAAKFCDHNGMYYFYSCNSSHERQLRKLRMSEARKFRRCVTWNAEKDGCDLGNIKMLEILLKANRDDAYFEKMRNLPMHKFNEWASSEAREKEFHEDLAVIFQ